MATFYAARSEIITPLPWLTFALPFSNVSVPRVTASPVAIECFLNQVVSMTTRNGTPAASQVIFGEVVGIHIAEHVIVDGMVDIRLMRPLSRLGYMDYSVIKDVFSMKRPY